MWFSYLHAPVSLSPGMNPGAHSVGGLVGHRAGLDVLEKRSLALVGIRTLQRLAHSLVIILTNGLLTSFMSSES